MSSVALLARPEPSSRPVSQIAELCQALWEIEDRYGLLYRRDQGCYPWAYRRMKVYYKLAAALGAFELVPQPRLRDDDPQVHRAPPDSNDYPRRYLLRFALAHGRPDWLVIPKLKLPNHGEAWRCPYTAPVIESALANDDRLLILWNGVGWHREQAREGGRQFGQLSADWVRRWIRIEHESQRIRRKTKFTAEEVGFWKAVDRELRALIGGSVDLAREMQYAATKFKEEQFVYRWILRLMRPRRIVLFCHYGKGAIIDAARRRNIATIEIQHGTIGPYHLGYSFPAWKRGHDPIPYFPDEFWSWGSYWTDKTVLPLPDDKIVARGFPHFRRQVPLSSPVRLPREARTILVLSQTVITEPLVYAISQIAKRHPDYHFIFKCHPSEDPRLAKGTLERYRNVKVVSRADLYSTMRRSHYVVGVFSTALYEAIALGCKPLLLNLPGIEYMQDLIDAYGVPVYNTGDDFLARLNQAQHCHVPQRDLF